jgi:type II secretory pathway pseudopilin PulG
LTLIELLVVVSIMMLLVVMTVPRMRPAMEIRRIREAARAVNVYLSSARNRAIETGRAWGVAIVRDGNSPLAGSKLIQLEVPLPYRGDIDGAGMRLQDQTPTGPPHPDYGYATLLKAQVRGGAMGGATELSSGLLRWGDRIQFNSQGPIYRIVDDRTDNNPANTSYPPATSAGTDFPITPVNAVLGNIDFSVGADTNGDGWIDNRWLTLVADNLQTYSVPWPVPANGWSQPLEFTVYRQPVTSSVAPLQLPRNVVIDLWYSGTSSSWFANSATTAASTPFPTIMFSSAGSVSQIAADTFGVTPALEPVYLLIGRRDRVNPAPSDVLTYNYQAVSAGPTITVYEPRPVAEDGLANFRDQDNLWIAINPQTGYVVSAEAAVATNVLDYQNTPVRDTSGVYFLFDPIAARSLAREFQSMGGR